MSAATIADNVLDRLVVPSFSRLGPTIRRRLFQWETPDVKGKQVAITGPTSGLGLAAATALASGGANLTLIARNPVKAEKVFQKLDLLGDGEIAIIIADLIDIGSTSEAGYQLAQMDRLDALIHNGGALYNQRQETAEGIEQTLAVHVVSPFALTCKALPALQRTEDSRIITVSSGGMYTQSLNLNDLQNEQGYSGAKAYAQAKRAQIALNELWADRLIHEGVSVHTMHPGWAATPGVSDALPGFDKLIGPLLRSPQDGADTIVWLTGAPREEISTGQFWLDRRPRSTTFIPGTAHTTQDAEQLWDQIRTLAGITEAIPGDE